MSRHGPQAGSIRPRIAGERLTAKQRRALLYVGGARFIESPQLHALVGSYATNVLKSLERRGLIRCTRGTRTYRLTGHGRSILKEVQRFAEGS